MASRALDSDLGNRQRTRSRNPSDIGDSRRPYGRTGVLVILLTPLGASSARKATVEAFVETSFKTKEGNVVRPDGLIRVSFGKNVWTALVEVKTGQNQLRSEQVNASGTSPASTASTR